MVRTFRGPAPRGRAIASIAVLLAVVTLSACVSPALNDDGYRGKVVQSAKKMVGIIGAGQLAAELDLQGKMISTITDQVVSQAEQDAQSVLTAFDSVQPPTQASVDLRTKADNILQPAASQLADLRVAQRRNDDGAMQETLDQLAKTLKAVQDLQDSP